MAATPGQAAQVVQATAYSYSPTAAFGGVSIVSPAFTDGVAAGRFLSTLQDVNNLQNSFDVYTFCINPTLGYFTFSAYDVLGAGGATADAVKQVQLAALLANANSAIDGGVDAAAKTLAAAAINLAIWEVLYEPGNAGYSLAGGNFSTYGDFELGASSLAQTYLGNVASNAWTGSVANVRTLVSINGSSQNQIYYMPGVPEPTTWALMIIGIGFVGVALRKRQAPLPA